MKKIILLIASAFLLNVSYAQISDSVNLTAGYSNQVFYKLSDGTKTSSLSTDWDLQFFSSLFSASIRVNSGFGVELYSVSNSDTTNFATTTLDTIGKTLLRDDNTNWELDAFTSTATGHPNYGWGYYQGTGKLVGIKVFAIKLTSGAVKKIWIKSFETAGQVNIVVADLDGSNLVVKTLNRTTYSTKKHFYYDVEGDAVLDAEPVSSDWELVFRKYVENVGGGQFYSVTGAFSNYNTEIAQVNNVEVGTAKLNWATYTYNTEINIAGSDWKDFNMSTFVYDVQDSLSYLIKDNAGDIYQLIFTGFAGSSTGKVYFTKELITTASINENSLLSSVGVYPNPVNDILTVTYEAKETINSITFDLIDMNGRIVKSLGGQNGVSGMNQGRINISDLNKGVYLLSIKADNSIITKRIIKN
jgi:hypothetical protein